MSRAEQVLEENKKIDEYVKGIKELCGDNISNDNVNMLAITSINKQLIDISITMALIYDLLNNVGIEQTLDIINKHLEKSEG